MPRQQLATASSVHSWERPNHSWETPQPADDVLEWRNDCSDSEFEAEDLTPGAEFVENLFSLLMTGCLSCQQFCTAMYFAHRAHTPPIIFMIPAVINMIPGLLSYEFMMGMIDWISGGKGQKPSVEEIIQTFSYGISTVFILFALAFGVAFPVVVFKSYTVKGKDLNVMIKKLFARNSEET